MNFVNNFYRKIVELLEKRKAEKKVTLKRVEFPTKSYFLKSFVFVSLILLLSFAFVAWLTPRIPRHYVEIPLISSLMGSLNVFNLFIAGIYFLWLFFAYKVIRGYIRYLKKKRDSLNKQISYMIESLQLYEQDTVEYEDKNGRRTRRKIITNVLPIYYTENEKNIYIRVIRDGGKFTEKACNLGENLSATLDKELETKEVTNRFVNYKFLKSADKRINLKNVKNNESDYIQITENIGFNLSKVPHALIVGGTGSGKSFFILSQIVSYLRLTPQADLRIIDPKRADLSLLRFVDSFKNKVTSEPHQILKMLRETTELMEKRYSTYFDNVGAFGKTYTNFGLNSVIVVFDEFSAFIHSVDKKLAKECIDYVYQIILKGRQAGVFMNILMQRPSADDLPTNIRAQMGLKVGLGAMDSTGYKMIFDTTEMDYKTVTTKGGGYIQVDGQHLNPVYFETPLIDGNFDFMAEIERLMNK